MKKRQGASSAKNAYTCRITNFYVTPKAKKWIAGVMEETGRTQQDIIRQMIECARLGEHFHIDQAPLPASYQRLVEKKKKSVKKYLEAL